jgi:hypothetical protein
MAVGLPGMRARWTTPALVVTLLAAACAGAGQDVGSDRDPLVAPADTASTPDPYPDLQGPPPVTLRFGNEAIELEAYSYCFESVCADGFPPEPLPDVGSPDDLVVDFPLEGWTFTTIFTPTGAKCGRNHHVPLTAGLDGTFALGPAGLAGTYDVTLFGEGGGDLSVAFRWTTPTDGPLPQPEARLALLADHDGRLDSYGVELHVSNLARTPRRAAASITVRSDTGDTITFEATPSDDRCLPEGTVYWDGPDSEGLAAAALDGETFMYEVELVLDGAVYVGTGTWPDDEIVGNEPSVALEFTPDLPALS